MRELRRRSHSVRDLQSMSTEIKGNKTTKKRKHSFSDEDNDDDSGNGRHSKGSSSSGKRSKIDQRKEDDQACIDNLEEMLNNAEETEKLLEGYIGWHEMTVADAFLSNDQVESKEKLDNFLEELKRICRSQAWGMKFEDDLEGYPNFIVIKRRKDLKKGDMELLENCQACNREKRRWSVKVKLHGQPYKRKTYKATGQSKRVRYYMGNFCHHRTKLFHDICHFGHVLFQKCKKKAKCNEDEPLFQE
ncbi:uncharacterized protein LOC132734137, partial [Ruditapes philippinarum]|uniref:uncharacterized protein LOC132734137 n=1 Tax=Ruditapes philippinarum TaxID=129788 RepID=UPI00295BA8BF